MLVPSVAPETSSLVAMEALASGTPVIAFACGAVPEVVEDGVTGFIVRNVDQAVSAVARLPTLDRLSVRARFERRFTVERMAQDYLVDLSRTGPAFAPTPQGCARWNGEAPALRAVA